MNKRLFFLLAAVLMLLVCAPALAQEAEDLTAQCKFTVSTKGYKLPRISDRDWGTTYISDKQRNPVVEIAAPKASPIYGVYICFGDKLTPWEIQGKRGGKWTTLYESEGVFAHEYAPLPEGEKNIRIRAKAEKQMVFTISEIFLFGEGEVPSYVQQWQPAPEKADLLVLAGHPDDEILFFGGTIPYYAGERGMNVVVAYLTCGTYSDGTQVRRSELLNGLWEMGVRMYPVIGDFWDKYSKRLETAYDAWGKTKVYQFITQLIRQYKPEVVVTHDVNGEYGHGAHRVCADSMLNCIPQAADAGRFPDSAAQFGVWQVKKLYLHLGKSGQIEMDWDQPLSAFDGRTGFQMAQAGFEWHKSQHEAGQKNPDTGKFEYFVVEDRSSPYSCYRFGLALSTVGPDLNQNDFFENVPGY